MLLRHAVALYSEHFLLFFKLSVLGSLPLIFCAIFIALADWGMLLDQPSQLLELAFNDFVHIKGDDPLHVFT